MFVDSGVQALFFVGINIYRSSMIPCEFVDKENVLNHFLFQNYQKHQYSTDKHELL